MLIFKVSKPSPHLSFFHATKTYTFAQFSLA